MNKRNYKKMQKICNVARNLVAKEKEKKLLDKIKKLKELQI